MDLLEHLIVPQRGDYHNRPPSPPAPPTFLSSLITRPLPDSMASQAVMQTTENAYPQPDAASALGNAFSIEEYERMHGGNQANDKRQRSPNTGSPKTPKKTSNANSPPAFTPTMVSTHTGGNTAAFNTRCQALGVAPNIEYTGSGSVGWSVRLDLAGSVLEDAGPHTNKKQAKDNICGAGLKLLKELEEKGEISLVKRKAGGAGDAKTGGTEEAVENCIGLLLEYARSTSTPEPTYNEYSAGPLFSCEVELTQRPGEPFGGRNEPYSNKKAARSSAARKAVEWLRAEGLLSEDGPVRKKKAKANSPSGGPNSSPKGAAGKGEDTAETESYVHKVIAIARTLGLAAPEYRLTPTDPRAPAFWDVAAYFSQSLSHEGPVGEVKQVHGKKAAKEECAKRVLAYLKGEEQKRSQNAQGFINSLKQ
ncbi:uncharacterized protein K441DRAFT_658709 [Cenococcum geophilum 1.58]|uniref:uncharacterized protein n=1 Tax=Cenococcum geophilum 1.58 TaxID=794803 RepID=UPI00358FFA59|nr:hypothetical protein K441DRAFT_658709 [Cenococcum geophilum 1.58]